MPLPGHHPKIRWIAETRSPEGTSLRPPDWLPQREAFWFWISAFRPRGSVWAGTLVVVAVLLSRSQGGESTADFTSFQFGFSSNMLMSVNHNDARADLRVWAQTVARERDIPTDPNPRILNGVEEISGKLSAHELDAIALTTVEYRQLLRAHPFTDLFLAVQGGRTNVEYLLLTQRDGPVQDLAGLQGRKLGGIQAADASCLESALSLLGTHDRLCGGTNAMHAAVEVSAQTDKRLPR